MKPANKLLVATATVNASAVSTVELKVTYWWTSGGKASAVIKLAEAINAFGITWVDGAIAGSSGTARPIITLRGLGGDPIGATQLDHGCQVEELIEAGNWAETVNPPSLPFALSCVVTGLAWQ